MSSWQDDDYNYCGDKDLWDGTDYEDEDYGEFQEEAQQVQILIQLIRSESIDLKEYIQMVWDW
jgi:hypothetical protein